MPQVIIELSEYEELKKRSKDLLDQVTYLESSLSTARSEKKEIVTIERVVNVRNRKEEWAIVILISIVIGIAIGVQFH